MAQEISVGFGNSLKHGNCFGCHEAAYVYVINLHTFELRLCKKCLDKINADIKGTREYRAQWVRVGYFD